MSKYENKLGVKHQLIRLVWSVCWGLFASWIPRSVASGWKRCLLRCFGAKIDSSAVVYSTAKIYYPKNLIMGKNSCIASNVDCYNVDMIIIGKHVTVSQKAFLCTASHNIESDRHELITKPVIIEDKAWVGAGAYIGLGVTIGEGAVVGATASVYKSIEPWTVVGGNPAKTIKKRVIKYA